MVRRKLQLAAIAAVAAQCVAGCITPLPTPFAKREPHVARSTTPTTTPPARLPTTDAKTSESPANVTGVLDKLEQVRALDPTAEPKLLAELRRTPPDSWPLVAEQFRASLAYSQQLRGQEQVPVRDDELVAASHGMASEDMQAASENVVSTPLGRPSLAASGPPSTPLRGLVDPHAARTENVAALAKSLRSNATTVANASTDVGGTATLLNNLARNRVEPQADASSESAVEPALFQAPGEAGQVVTRAAATTEDGVPNGLTAVSTGNDEQPTNAVGAASKPMTDEAWQQLVRQAADDLSKRVAASPSTTAEIHQHVSLRMLWLLLGDTEKALEPIPHITPAEQDYWLRQLFALATYLDHHSQPDDKRRAAASVIHLDEAASHLRELGSLSLRNIAFCKNVYGYGAIEPYEKDAFKSGQQVSLYVEVENYHSESKEKGYCTLLGATYEILDDNGKRISGGNFPDVDDCCRSRRRDFHIQFGLTVPQNMTPGHYRLELVVKDRQSDKMGHATAPFEIGAGK